MPKKDYILSHLFLAAPELLLEDAFVNYLHRRGFITNEGLARLAMLQQSQSWIASVRRKTRNKPLLARIVAVAPEILNRRTIDLLERMGKIGKQDASVVRVWLGVSERSRGPLPTSVKMAAIRARRMFGFGFVDDLLALMVTTDQISQKEASLIRGELLTGRIVVDQLKAIQRAKSFYEAMALVGSGLVDRRTVEAMRLTGLINSRAAESLLLAASYGKAQWTVWEGAKKAEGLAARMAYVVSGSFSFEMLAFLKATKKLTPEQALLLQIGVQISQRYNRELMEQMTDRKFRVVPGEQPIQSYHRAAKETDDALLRLLAEASRRSAAEANALAAKGGRGRALRAAEYALNARALHQSMRQVWEGTGYLTIFGERKVAEAAIEASEVLQARYLGKLPGRSKLMLERQARAGIDSYISRKENTLQLSRRVYGNLNLWTRKVDREVQLGLLQGKSAKEIADSVEHLINPNVMGGVKYAAMRLGRTELANAFHTSTIRHTREMPWVRGYKWHRSRSHRHSDVCDEYANEDHDGIGEGVFKKKNVPGKPHPQCLCYLTVVGMDDDEWLKAYKAGRFNQYMALRARSMPKNEIREILYGQIGTALGRVGAQVAISQTASLAQRMMQGGKTRSVAVPQAADAISDAKKLPLNKQVPFLRNNATFNSIVDDMNRAMPEDRGPLTNKEQDSIAKALLANEKKLKKYNNELAGRKARFDALSWKRDKSGIRLDDFDEESYRYILEPDSGMDPAWPATTARGLYGTRAYRVINDFLRKSNGSMARYDTEFGEGVNMWKDLAGEIEDDPDTWGLSERALVNFSKRFKIPLTKDPIMGRTVIDYDTLKSKDNDGVHYWDSVMENHLAYDDEDEGVFPFRRHSDVIRSLDSQMEKTKGDRMVFRVTGNDWFGLNRDLTANDVGRVFTDHGYTSTEGLSRYYSGIGNAALMLKTDRRPNRVKIFLPDGTDAMRLNDIEYEILLARGSTFQVLDVRKSPLDMFRNEIDIMLVKQKKRRSSASTSSDEDIWDSLMGEF